MVRREKLKGKKEIKVEKSYLGDYQTLQYLDDCGFLDKILHGHICPHFRVFKGRVFYRYAKL